MSLLDEQQKGLYRALIYDKRNVTSGILKLNKAVEKRRDEVKFFQRESQGRNV